MSREVSPEYARVSLYALRKNRRPSVHSGKSLFSPKLLLPPIVILFWLKWAGYLAVAGLNPLAQLSDRISPYGV